MRRLLEDFPRERHSLFFFNANSRSSPNEAARLTELVLTAKAHWGYSNRQLELWREGLTVTEEQVLSQPEAFYIRYGETVTGLIPAPVDEQPARVRPQLLLST